MYLLTGFLGLMAMVALFLFGFSQDTAALWTSLITGAVLIVDSTIEGFAGDKGRWEYCVAGGVGMVAIVAPFVLGFSALVAAVWTLAIVGLITIIASGMKLTSGKTRFGY